MDRINVRHYQSFADFFQSWIAQGNSLGRKRSYRWIARRLGLKSHSHVVALAHGNRIPSAKTLLSIVELCGLEPNEYEYVACMVAIERAKKEMARAQTLSVSSR